MPKGHLSSSEDDELQRLVWGVMSQEDGQQVSSHAHSFSDSVFSRQNPMKLQRIGLNATNKLASERP